MIATVYKKFSIDDVAKNVKTLLKEIVADIDENIKTKSYIFDRDEIENYINENTNLKQVKTYMDTPSYKFDEYARGIHFQSDIISLMGCKINADNWIFYFSSDGQWCVEHETYLSARESFECDFEISELIIVFDNSYDSPKYRVTIAS